MLQDARMSQGKQGLGSSRRRSAGKGGKQLANVVLLAGALVAGGLLGTAGMLGTAGPPGDAPGPVSAQAGSAELSVVAQIGGGLAAFQITEDHLFASNGPRIAIYDLRRPEAPQQVALTAPFPEVVKGLAVDGDRLVAVGWGAYVEASGYLIVLDIADPARPRVLGQRSLEPVNFPGAVATRGGLVYLLDEGAGKLHVIDATDPADIRFDRTVAVGPVDMEDRLYLAGDRLWMTSGGLDLVAFDLVGPAAPREIGRFAPSGEPLVDVAFAGDLAYATDEAGFLHVVDIRSPAAMARVFGVHVGPEAASIAAGDGYLHVVRSYGVTTLTLANPRRPEPIGTLEIDDVLGLGTYTRTHIGMARGHVFLISDDGTLRAIDYADPANPELVASARVLPIVEDVAVEDDVAYIAADWGGLWTFDVADPAAPRLLGMTDVDADEINPAGLSTLTVSGGFVYAFDAWDGMLYTIDATDPAAPEVLGQVEVPAATGISTIHSIAYADGTLWIPYANQLIAVDVSEPDAPLVLGSLELPGADSVAVAEDAIYVGGADERSQPRVYVVDPADPTAPIQTGHVGVLGSSAPAVTIDGFHLFVTGDGLTVFDIHDPGALRQLLRYRREANPWISDLAVSEGFAFVLSDTMQLFDVHDPRQAAFVVNAAIPVPDFVAGGRMRASGAFAYLANGEAGLTVLQRGDVLPTPTDEPPGTGAVYLPWAQGGP